MKNKILFFNCLIIILALFAIAFNLSFGTTLSALADEKTQNDIMFSEQQYLSKRSALILELIDKLDDINKEYRNYYQEQSREILGQSYYDDLDKMNENWNKINELTKNSYDGEEIKSFKNQIDQINQNINEFNKEESEEKIDKLYSELKEKFSAVEKQINILKDECRELSAKTNEIYQSNQEKMEELYKEENKLRADKYREIMDDFYSELHLLNSAFNKEDYCYDFPFINFNCFMREKSDIPFINKKKNLPLIRQIFLTVKFI